MCSEMKPVCKNCEKGLDDHRADSIDCPKYRKTMRINDEEYQSHIKNKQLTNSTSENTDDLWAAVEENEKAINSLADNFNKFVKVNSDQMAKLTLLVGKAIDSKMKNDIFLDEADKILDGKVKPLTVTGTNNQ